MDSSPHSDRLHQNDVVIYSKEEKERIKEEARTFAAQIKENFADIDYESHLDRGSKAREAYAVRDILFSQRLPFSAKVQPQRLPPLLRRQSTSRRGSIVSMRSRNSISVEEINKSRRNTNTLSDFGSITARSAANHSQYTSEPSLKRNSVLSIANNSPSLQSSAASRPSSSSGRPITGETNGADPAPAAAPAKTVDRMLQEALELITTAKTSINASLCMFQAAEIFDALKMYDRAAHCYHRATISSNPEIIVDTDYLPQDVNYHRKVERMSPIVLPQFLADRKLLREQLIIEERERQRHRKIVAHYQLVRLYLMTNIKNLEKAHINLVEAFKFCRGEEEHVEYLYSFHYLILEYQAVIGGRSDFTTHKQILRSSAGPIADDHLQILLDIVKRDDNNHVMHEWIAKRYAEKCDFDNSHKHYLKVRNLTVDIPSKEEAMLLLKSNYTGENNKLLIEQRTKHLVKNIAENIQKRPHQSYGSHTEQEQDKEVALNKWDWVRRDGDYAWFGGRHADASVTIFHPPQQGWTS